MLTRAWSSCGCRHFADGESGDERKFPPVRRTNNIPELAHPQIEALPRAVRAEEEGLPPLAGCCAPVLDRQPPASPGARASYRDGAEAPAGWRTVAHGRNRVPSSPLRRTPEPQNAFDHIASQTVSAVLHGQLHPITRWPATSFRRKSQLQGSRSLLDVANNSQLHPFGFPPT